MKIKTYTEELAELQQAITSVLTGAQEASYNGQRVKKADLDMLQRREEYLRKQIATERRGGIRVRRGVPK